MAQILSMLAAALFFIVAICSNTATAATLRDQVTVAGPQVMLSDIFADLGAETTDKPVAMAPAPGRHAVFDAAFLRQIALTGGVDWKPLSLADYVDVVRASAVITPEMIVAGVAEKLKETTGSTQEERLISLDNKTMLVHVPADQEVRVDIQNLSYDASRGRFRGVLLAAGDGGAVQRLPISGRVQLVVAVPVLNRPLRAGDTIGSGDVDFIELEQGDAKGAVLDEGDLIGKELRRAMVPNKPLLPRDVRSPRMITKGSLVTMTLQTPVLLLTAQGKALDDGAQGDVIRIVNTRSSKVVQGTVTGPDAVSVTIASVN